MLPAASVSGWYLSHPDAFYFGVGRLGPDQVEAWTPHMLSLERLAAFSVRKGCYPGQEVVARMDTYGMVRRHLVGLKLKDGIVPPKGTKLFSGDREVGWISSAAKSPSLGYVVALGFPLRDFSQPGTALSVEIDGKRYEATIQTLPFTALKT